MMISSSSSTGRLGSNKVGVGAENGDDSGGPFEKLKSSSVRSDDAGRGSSGLSGGSSPVVRCSLESIGRGFGSSADDASSLVERLRGLRPRGVLPLLWRPPLRRGFDSSVSSFSS